MECNKSKNELVTILVNTCDCYSDLWEPFNVCLKRNWGDNLPWEIVWNVETIGVPKEFGRSIFSKKNLTWSKRLKKCLKQLHSEYICFLLEDFFIYNKVDQNKLDKIIQDMSLDKKIACCYLAKTRGYVNGNECICDGVLQKRSQTDRYLVNAIPSIWRRKSLIKLLSRYENAWQFEGFASERARLLRYSFYDVRADKESLIATNLDFIDGVGVFRGKWQRGTKKIFDEYGIEMDYSLRGFATYSDDMMVIKIPKITTTERFKYFLHGGYPEDPYMSIGSQLKMMFVHPRTFLKATLRKFKFIFRSFIYAGKEISMFENNKGDPLTR